MAADLTVSAPAPSCQVREVCAGCGGKGLLTVLDLGSSPLADRFPATPAEVEPWFPLRMLICPSCWLAQLGDVVDGGALFGDGYGFVTGASPAAVTYFREFADWALHRFPGDSLVVEIGCSDGTLLRRFRDAGRQVLGVEPASPAGQIAQDSGLDVLREPFTAATGPLIRDGYGPASLVVACNVAAHTADPVGFLAGIAGMLAPDGAAVIEFQNLADLVAGGQFDHVYHEHRFFYSLASFTALAAQAGLVVTGAERTPAQGGSLRVTAVPARRGVWAASASGQWLRCWAAYAGLQARAEYVRDRLTDMIAGAGTVAGYGATAKSATLLNFCRLGPAEVGWVEDVTPAKTGRYTPGTHIPITAPGERGTPDTFLLLAWNYLPSVWRREQAFTSAGGRFIVPIPVPVLL